MKKFVVVCLAVAWSACYVVPASAGPLGLFGRRSASSSCGGSSASASANAAGCGSSAMTMQANAAGCGSSVSIAQATYSTATAPALVVINGVTYHLVPVK